MSCPNCGTTMDEVSKWEMAPFGGWKCPSCGLTISRKTSSCRYKLITLFKRA